MVYICHSGGCPGSDLAWEAASDAVGIVTISYSFSGHKCEGKRPHIMSTEQLNEGWDHAITAAKSLNRPIEGLGSTYVKSLICRNWFQVKNSNAVYAIGTFLNRKKQLVNGGTGWAVQMAVNVETPVYFFDQSECSWFYRHKTDSFVMCDTPKLTPQFAGIGTRDINQNGLEAIISVFDKTFN